MVVMRTEKAGVGDSEGGPCAGLDYETELTHHRAALAALLSHPWVDPDRVIVYGASMGANMAPLVAAGQNVKAIAVWAAARSPGSSGNSGSNAAPWSWRASWRRDLRAAAPPLALLCGVSAHGLSPAEIARRDAKLGAAWSMATGTEGATQFGRPLAFHQQAQRREWAGAWAAVGVPVLALFGEYD